MDFISRYITQEINKQKFQQGWLCIRVNGGDIKGGR